MINHKANAVIQVIRNPFDAILSEFNKEYGSGNKGEDPHTLVAPTDYFETIFPRWFDSRSELWLEYMKFWLEEKYWENLEEETNQYGVTSFQIERKIFGGVLKDQPVPVLVVFFEDFVRNFEETSNRVLSFLKIYHNEAVPDPEVATICALEKKQLEASAKRSNHEKFNPYLKPKLEQKLEAFCESIKSFWYVEKWGDCKEAPLQSYREDVLIFKSPALPSKDC